MKKCSKLRKSKIQGASLIEFALVAPVLLLIMFAVIEYSIMFAALTILNQTTAEGARQASVFRSGFSAEDYRADAVAAMGAELPTFINGFTARVQLAGALEDCAGQTCLRLTATYPDYAASPLVSGYLGALGLLPADLSADSYARLSVTSVGL